jgi:hypothetical protein
MATLAELRSTILGKYDVTTPTRPDTSQVDAQINSTIEFYENEYFWFMEDTAAIILTIGDPVIPNIPTDFKEQRDPNAVVLIDGEFRCSLKHVHPLEYDTIFNTFQSTRPYIYTYRNGQFEVYPIPDQAYVVNLEYRKRAVDLVSDGDTNIFSINAVRLIEYKTLADLLRDYKNDFARADKYDQRAEIEKRSILRETRRRLATGMLSTDDISGDGYYDSGM